MACKNCQCKKSKKITDTWTGFFIALSIVLMIVGLEMILNGVLKLYSL